MRNALKLIGLIGLVVTVGIGEQMMVPYRQAAIAQVSDTPQPDSNGDFNTAILSGHLGNYYPNNRWLVMPQLDNGALNCRESPNGRIVARVVDGAIIQASFNQPIQSGGRGSALNPGADAIDLASGKPWLKVTATGNLFFPPARSEGGDRAQPTVCYVRANLQYIAPINEEATAF